MIRIFSRQKIDWVLFFATFPLLGAGLITMNAFVGESSFFNKQVIWILVSIAVFIVLSFLDFRFLRRTDVIVFLFMASCALLLALLIIGGVVRGAQSWFSFGGVSFQPSDIVKLSIIIVLAKYFTRRHMEIKHIKDTSKRVQIIVMISTLAIVIASNGNPLR